MRGIQRVRIWLIVIGGIFLLLDITAAVLVLSPAGRSRAAKEKQYTELRAEMLAKRRDSMPARDMDSKLKAAKEQVATFYDERLPSHYSEISDVLGKEAAANHVLLSSAKYDAVNERQTAGGERQSIRATTGLQRLEITVDVDGNYADLMHFLNSLERSKMFFIPEQVSFGGQQQSGLRVTIRLETYLRTGMS